MKKSPLSILVFCIVSFSCTVETGINPSPAQEDLSFFTETTETEITVKLLRSEQNEEVSWYHMLIGKVGEELENKATYQDIINDTISYTFRKLEPKTKYTVQVEGKAYASDDDIISSGSKEVTTD